MRSFFRDCLTFTTVLIATACSDAEDPTPVAGMGGTLPATGGWSTADGGTATGGSSGFPTTGGAFATGGTGGTGGFTTGGFTTGGFSTGGFTTGGLVSTGGFTTGGLVSTGGFATGGLVSTGGFATGGLVSTGGFATGGFSTGGFATGGFSTGGFATGGFSTGGLATGGFSTGGFATGGVSTGGTATGGTTPTCNEGELEVCASYQTGNHCGLTFEIWTDSSESCMTNTNYGFQAYWDAGDLNYLARKGVRPGSAEPVVTYSADYRPDGNSYLAIYGWTQNPLIEYYIVDSWGTWRPPGTAVIGTFEVDGGTYEIYRSERVNQPSIEGTKTFWQYWSVRTQKRTSGTITVAPHFDAWASFGLTMGTFHEVSLVVEGYHSAGTADVTVSFQ